MKLRWGIRRKLVVSISSLSLLGAAAFAIYTPQRVERQAMRAMNARGRSIAQMTAYSVREPVAARDMPALNAMLQGTRRASQFTHPNRNAGLSIQPGVPAISSGGTQSVRSRCCTMWALNR